MKTFIRSLGLPAAAYLLITGVVFGAALFPPTGMLLYGDDIHHAYYFFREFFNLWLSRGIFPWWNPYIFGGQPFIADPMVNIWYPPTWLFAALPLPVAYSWHLALHVCWAMLGMYVLSKRSFVSGIVFGLSGFFMARTWAGHADVIASASWLPWVVWAFWKLITVPRSRPDLPLREVFAAAVVFAFQLFSGYQTMAFFTVMIVGCAAIVRSVMGKTWVPLWRSVVAGGLGVGLAAIQILPEQEFFRMGVRTYDLPYRWISYGSWTWKSMAQLLNPFHFGNQVTYAGPPPNFIEHSAFVGVGGLLFFVIGLVRSLRDRKEIWGKIWIIVAVFGLWVSLGPNAPIDLQYILWKSIPMYRYLRIPPRHLILVVFGLAGLSGIGFSSLKLPKVLRTILTGLIVMEMIVFGRQFIELRPVPEARHDKELVLLLQQDTQPYRVLQNFGVWLPQRDALDFDAVMPYGIFSATGYDPSIIRPYYDYVARASGAQGNDAVSSHDVQVPYLAANAADALDRLNIKYLMVPSAYDPFAGNTRYRLVRTDTVREYRVYANTTVKPRFYFADPCGEAHVSSYTPNRIMLTTESSCATTLLSSEVWYPGWTATIDGKNVSIYKEKDVFRALFVSPGTHTVVYRYVPRIFLFGAVMSLGTLLLCASWYWFRVARRANI